MLEPRCRSGWNQGELDPTAGICTVGGDYFDKERVLGLDERLYSGSGSKDVPTKPVVEPLEIWIVTSQAFDGGRIVAQVARLAPR